MHALHASLHHPLCTYSSRMHHSNVFTSSTRLHGLQFTLAASLHAHARPRGTAVSSNTPVYARCNRACIILTYLHPPHACTGSNSPWPPLCTPMPGHGTSKTLSCALRTSPFTFSRRISHLFPFAAHLGTRRLTNAPLAPLARLAFVTLRATSSRGLRLIFLSSASRISYPTTPQRILRPVDLGLHTTSFKYRPAGRH